MKGLHRLVYPPAWSIAAKISAALFATAIIPMGFTACYNLRQSLASLEAGEYRKLELLAASTASRLDQLIIDIQRLIVQVSSDRNVVGFLTATIPRKREALLPNLQRTLENVFHSNPDFDAVFLMDAQGKCLAATDPKFVGKNYAFREYFRVSIQGRPYISSILVGQTTKRPGLFLAYPVRSDDGKIVGVTVVKIRGENIWAIVNALQVGSQSYAFLIDQQGIVISHPNQSLLYHSLIPLSPNIQKQVMTDRDYGLKKITSLDISELAVMVKAKEPGHASYRSEQEQISRIVGFAPLQVQPWVLGISQPKTQFVAPLNHLIWQHGSSVLVVGGITAIIALLLARSISRPIHSLTAAAQALEQDNFHPKILADASRTQDDIGRLVRVFLNMAGEVKAREQKLKRQVIDLRVEIDETKRVSQVAEITENEHFRQLEQKIQKLRQQVVSSDETETDYFERLHSKVESLKQRSLNN
ncbi:HAMP domain-containing protein [Nostoc sp. CENA67]|uniref:histidine kinase n=1 Tax=Amazonocrinis nigriterrae CENA67 TaxID=2794033 RepID=A0A8J7HQ22_9NOST|nr:cache domain-containing protein [Amazonocrinis nigriterrae]MBH8563502.1 HAMP domain-containing protein [Amazonocrinis nigriterrae CENA67]